MELVATETADERGRTYRGMSAEDRQTDRRRRLLESARELYGSVGFAAVPIQALCKHAGVTARHFYELFDDRESVLEVVHDQIVDRVGGAVILAVLDVDGNDPYDIALAGLEAFYREMFVDPRDARIAILEVMQLPPAKAIVCVDHFTSIIEDYAAEMQADGRIAVSSVHLSSAVLVGAMRQLLIDWLTKTDKPTIDELVKVTHHLFAQVWGFDDAR